MKVSKVTKVNGGGATEGGKPPSLRSLVKKYMCDKCNQMFSHCVCGMPNRTIEQSIQDPHRREALKNENK